MRKIISATLALAMAATSAVAFTGESEARRGDRWDRYERHHYYDRGYDRGYRHGYRRHHRHHHGNEAAAAIAGLALGAIIVGATQDRSRYRGLSHVERCERRYRSYDRRTDTYIGRDGRAYYCRL